MGGGVGKLGETFGELGSVLCDRGHRPENWGATGSRRGLGEKLLRSGRVTTARWLSV